MLSNMIKIVKIVSIDCNFLKENLKLSQILALKNMYGPNHNYFESAPVGGDLHNGVD